MPLFEMYVAKGNKIRGLIAQFQASGMLVVSVKKMKKKAKKMKRLEMDVLGRGT